MAAPEQVVQAVRAGIVASAHLAAYEHVGAAALACKRLGSLSSGRWRSAARDLAALEDQLETAYASAAQALTAGANDLGVPEDALWTVGDAAGTLEMLREAALEQVDSDDPRTVSLLQGEVVFGASFVEDPELPDRGTTLLFAWSDPLAPTTWPWQANWVVGDGQDTSDDEDADTAEELDLFEAGEMEGDDSMLGDLAGELGCSHHEARTALRNAAMALTRASLLAGAGADDEDEDEDEDEEDQ